MLLTVDIGNSSIKFGIYNDDKLYKVFNIKTDNQIDITKYTDIIRVETDKCNISECIIASVAEEYNEIVKNIVKNIFGINALLLNSESNFGIKIDKSKSTGIDRIANALCAVKKYGTPAIVVDAGTAVTFDISDKDGCFIGGIIIPGIRLQLEALGKNTSKLPIYDIDESYTAIGNDTKSSILSGVIRGVAAAVDGLLEQCINEMNDKPIIIGTGGQAELISKYMKNKFDYIDSNHTLDGIRMLYELNKN